MPMVHHHLPRQAQQGSHARHPLECAPQCTADPACAVRIEFTQDGKGLQQETTDLFIKRLHSSRDGVNRDQRLVEV